MDWRFAPHDVLSIGFSEQYYDSYWHGRRWQITSGNNPTTITPDFVQSRPNAGTVTFTGNSNSKRETTWTPDFKYTHNGPVWRMEGRGAYSHASNYYIPSSKGHYSNINMTLGSFNAAGVYAGPTVRMDYTGNYVPGVTALNTAGVAVNARDVDNFFLNTALDLWSVAADIKKTAAFHAQRSIDLGVPFKLKAGGDIRQAIRDTRYISDGGYAFVGADRRARTADDTGAALGIVDEGYSVVSPAYGQPKFVWPSLYKIWDLYQVHPEWWTRNLALNHTNLVNGSKFIDETISSAFVRIDTTLFKRLAIVGGARFQQYRVHAESGEVNNLGRYLHDEDGNLLMDPETGRPLIGTANALEVSQRTNIERGVVTKGTASGLYPSFNAAYRLGENIQLRAGYAHSVNYPNLNQVAASTTVSDITAAQRRVTANSPLKPWFGRNYDVDIEYYTRSGGSFTLSYFRKEITDFIRSARHNAGTPEAPAALERYGYGQLAALDFEIGEKYNGGSAEFDGWEFDLRQSLDAYVPAWGRGLTVFFNTSYAAAPKGVNGNDISGASRRLFNWGARYHRGKFGANLRWNHVPQRKPTVPQTIKPNSRTLLDIDVYYRLNSSVTFFASGANATSTAFEEYVYTENTPDYARRRRFSQFGVQCTAGIKGQF